MDTLTQQDIDRLKFHLRVMLEVFTIAHETDAQTIINVEKHHMQEIDNILQAYELAEVA